MVPNRDVHLIPAKLTALRPTQMTVGYREVALKRAHWKTLDKKQRAAAIDAHSFPAVLGPESRYYIVDHHHLGRALLEEGVKEVKVMVLKDLSWLDHTIFWRMMEHNQWVHPFGADGSRYDYEHLPKVVTEMSDDPYRSLAGELRNAGGYAKDATPFSEFLWADFLRPRVSASKIAKNFAKALEQAKTLAHTPEARYLPGWSGVIKAV
ncbi:ParB-like protein [Paraburkholderia sp. BCC1885]|jgi:hypothetical protein|uniref:ParB-like protein n=1 Tax=Paraburkholderia sp. BCC1885 TaxID=2562669 RepID=UPI001182A088|nr:ParB-like protein [Paraburkholderia sp. BCC1885]